MQPEIDNEVIRHLLFHKALVDAEDDASRINEYVSMVQNQSHGEMSSITSVFDRSIAIVFDLVINQDFNPWNIDLASFSSLYLQRARAEKIDLVTAGRIIYMAWTVLRLQSDDLVDNLEAKQEEEPLDFDWGDLPAGTWMESDDGYSYTNLIMRNPRPPLEKPVRRDGQRKVTLIELLDAFDQARKESEEYQLVDQMRREERERLAALARKHMKGTTHEDHLEEDVTLVWNRICEHPKKMMTLGELCETKSFEDRIKTLLSVLFLAYDNKIKVFQRRFPYGKIFIKTIGYT